MKKINCCLLATLLVLLATTVSANMSADMNWTTKSAFPDVPYGHWAYEAVGVLAGNKLLNGDEQGLFRPDNFITRAETVKILAVYEKLDGKVPQGDVFADVEKSAWYAGYAESDQQFLPEILEEDGKRYFHPEDLLTREEAMYAAVRLVDAEDELSYRNTALLQNFSDSAEIAPKLVPYVQISIDKHLINGYTDGTLRAKNPLTRAEFAAIIYRCIQPKIHVSLQYDAVSVTSMLNKTKSLEIVLRKRGVNNIFDFDEWVMPNVQVGRLARMTTMRIMSSTDSYAPYIVLAKNNADGDKSDFLDFTGGNHCYTGLGTGGSATGRTDTVEVYANGVKIENGYDGDVNTVDIIYTNFVQAGNTKKADGTGREVLKETNHIHYDGDKWKNTLEMTALEDIEIVTYYGMALQAASFGDKITYYAADKENGSTTVNSNSRTDDKTCDRIMVTGGNFDVEMRIDTGYGLGTQQHNIADYSAFSAQYGKVYFNLIRTDENHRFLLSEGETDGFRGYYRYSA